MSSSDNRIELGSVGEHHVVCYLEKEGFTVLAKNYRVSGGEIDVVALKNQLLVFVEVKTRKNPLFDLTQVITAQKQRKIIYAAHHYITTHRHTNGYSFRFDVALVEHTNKPSITYIPDAFNDENKDW